MKKIIRVLVLISVILSIFACNSSKVAVTSYRAGTSVDSMDTISFGSYPQTKNGGKKPIKWIILEQKGGEILLLSKYILDNRYFNDNENSDGITWENCTLRKWLNEEFYNTVFKDNEKKKIVKSNIVTIWKEQGNGPYGMIERQVDTSDYVYILSAEECDKYFKHGLERGISKQVLSRDLPVSHNRLLATKYTEYADKYKVKEYYNRLGKEITNKDYGWRYGTASFMLRNGWVTARGEYVGENNSAVYYYASNHGTYPGEEISKAEHSTNYGYGLRPVIRIKLK